MFKKAIKILGSVLLLLLLVLCIVPVIFKKQIEQKVKAEINNEVNAHVDYSSLSFSLFTGFWHPTISLNNFVVTGLGEFNGDTLAALQKLTFSLDLSSILRGNNYKITSLSITKPDIRLWVNKEGHANWGIMKLPVAFTKDATPVHSEKHADFSLQVDDWLIEHGNISYRNDTVGNFLELGNFNSDGNQPGTGAYSLGVGVHIDDLTYRAGETTYCTKIKVQAHILYSLDPVNNTYYFRDNFVQLNTFQVNWNGTIKKTDEEQSVNMSFYSRDETFKNLLSLFPMVNDSSFDKLKAEGNLTFGGSVKGIYKGNQYPAISINLGVQKGTCQKSGFPAAIKNILLEAHITKPQGPLDSTVIQVSQLHVETGNDAVNGSLLITTPESNANIQAQLSGLFDLSTLRQFYASDKAEQLSGAVSGGLKFNARKNDIGNKNYKFIQASGSISASNVIYENKGATIPLRFKEATLTFHPGFTSLDKLNGSIGKSDFRGTGRLNDLIPYIMGKGGLNTSLNLESDSADLRDFINWVQPSQSSGHSVTATNANQNQAPASGSDFSNASFTLNVAIRKVYFDNVVVEKAKGTIEVSKDLLGLKNVTGDLLGGSFSTNVSCKKFNSEQPDVTFNVGVNNFDIHKVYQSTDNTETTSPFMKYLSGNFSGQITGNGKLNADKSPNYKALSADGKLQIPNLRIDSMPVLIQIGQLAKVKSLDHLETKNVSSVFHYKNGKIVTEPTDIKFTNGYKIGFAALSNPDHTIDADVALDVPVKEFGSLGGLAQTLLSNFTKVAQSLQFKFKLTGNSTKPTVKVVGMALPQN